MLPRVVVFDLDGTLWSPEMYELWGGGSPFQPHAKRKDALLDKSGRTVALLGDARSIMQQLAFDPRWKQNKTIVGISSTCDEPAWARECMSKLFLDDANATPMTQLFEGFTEIYSALKSEQFRQLLRKAQRVDPSIDDFSHFLFFDNQRNNIEDVGRLGVTCIYCPDGMQPGVWEKGLQQWEANQSKKKKNSASY
jgi:magnesium-dependent phosphatase 1